MAVWDLDLATGRLTWTGPPEGASGRPRPRPLSDFMRRVHPDDRVELEVAVQHALVRRGGFSCEFRTVGAHGEVRWIAAEGRTVTGPGGDAARLTGIGRDVTERRRAEEALRESEERFRAMADSAPVMIWLADRAGGLTYLNAAWLQFTGRAAADERGDGWITGVHPHDRPALMALRDRAVERGEGFRTEFRLRRADGEYRWVLAHSAPRRLADGDVEGHVGSAVDISERRAVEERYRLLAEIGLVLDTALSVDSRLSDLARSLLPAVADMCTVDLLDEGPDGSLRRVAAAHVDSGRARLLANVESGPATAVGRVADGEGPLLFDGAMAASRDPRDGAAPGDDLATRSVAIVPLEARGRRIGVLSIATSRDHSNRRLGPDDLYLAERIAARTALAIDNARLYEARSDIARTLQRALLPPALPSVPHATVSARYLPMGEGIEVGGDFYDVFPAGDGAWILAVGDVCGKGPEAAALTAMARYTLRALARMRTRPAQLLADLNRAVIEQRPGSTRFVTVCLARIDGGPGALRADCASAGHPPPLVQRADGRVERVEVRGPLIGIRDAIAPAPLAVTLGAGDRLVLYTDGLTEARVPGGMMGEDGLVATLRGLRTVPDGDIAAALTDTVATATGGDVRDDMAVLAIGAGSG